MRVFTAGVCSCAGGEERGFDFWEGGEGGVEDELVAGGGGGGGVLGMGTGGGGAGVGHGRVRYVWSWWG